VRGGEGEMDSELVAASQAVGGGFGGGGGGGGGGVGSGRVRNAVQRRPISDFPCTSNSAVNGLAKWRIIGGPLKKLQTRYRQLRGKVPTSSWVKGVQGTT